MTYQTESRTIQIPPKTLSLVNLTPEFETGKRELVKQEIAEKLYEVFKKYCKS